MQINGTGNAVAHGTNISLSGSVTGNNNSIAIGNASAGSSVRTVLNGNNNVITIGDCYGVKELSIHCGNHVAANGTSVIIGNGFSIEPGSAFLLYNSQSMLSIGKDCLFSRLGRWAPGKSRPNASGGIGLGGEAFALLTENLATEPLDLVFQRSNLLSLRLYDGGEFHGAQPTHFGERG